MNAIETGNILLGDLTEGDDPDNEAALPDDSLMYLERFCAANNIMNVFEFGSGRSTKAFLEGGRLCASLEDNEFWMTETLKGLNPSQLSKHTSFIAPLQLQWLNGIPFFDWKITGKVKNALDEAELVLIDSPHYTVFRESTLMQVLLNKSSNLRMIVLDDARIPTIERFCKRVANQSIGVSLQIVPVGHRFAVFTIDSRAVIKNCPSLYERLLGWRRFLLYWPFVLKMRSNSK